MRRESGTILAEIVIVALILAIGVLAVWSIFRQGSLELYKTENNLKAYNLAVEGLEWLVSLAFDEIVQLEHGATINGMRIAVDDDPEESWKVLGSYQYLDAYGDAQGNFEYPADFGDAGGSGVGTWRDFARWAVLEPVDASDISDADMVMATVVVEWVEQGKQHTTDADELAQFTRSESLSAFVGKVNRL